MGYISLFYLKFIYIYIIFFFFLSPSGQGSSRWVKVNEKRKLHDVLKEPNFIIPGIPGLYSLYTAYLLRHAITITTTYSRHAAVKYKIYMSVSVGLSSHSIYMDLCMQYFMLFQRPPASTKSSKVANGLLRHDLVA